MNGSRYVRAFFALLLALTLLLLGGSPAADAAGSRLLGTTTVTASDLLAKPAQRSYIVDTAGMVSAEDAAQIAKIGAELRSKTKAEIVVVTVSTLGGANIEGYANKLFRSWGIGDAQMNNGVLLLLLWMVGRVFGLAFLSLSALLNLLSSGRYGHMPSGGGGGTYYDDDDRPSYGGGSSGGGSYGGGSSGGGGASGNW